MVAGGCGRWAVAVSTVLVPIKTMYQGYQFRSRLEARWALFFDEIGITYWYEPQGFTLPDGRRYLPDFYLPRVDMYCEVKPKELTKEERAKVEALTVGTGCNVILLVGPPDFRVYECLWTWDGLPTPDSVLLDIHSHEYYKDEHRFFTGADGFGWDKEEAFTAQYRAAVYASRAARFED